VTTSAASGTVQSATVAFDRLASDYDALAAGEIFQLLRHRTHRAFARRFSSESRLLEIGCGTGLDTAFLAASARTVIACDPSEEMVSRTLRRIAHARLESRVTVLPCGLQHLASFLDALASPDAFDGIVSNFGALNCVEHLAPLTALARTYLRDGGVMLLGVMGRTCAVEAIYFTATRRAGMANRRRHPGAVAVPVAGIDVPTFYHRIADLRSTLGPEMILRSVEGIGVAIPPPYLEARWQQLPKTARRVVTRLDALLSPFPPFNRAGDHVLLEFVKRGHRG
jgi:ubiquinone/menaquinone biosynthesis C-methylase UbiE